MMHQRKCLLHILACYYPYNRAYTLRYVFMYKIFLFFFFLIINFFFYRNNDTKGSTGSGNLPIPDTPEASRGSSQVAEDLLPQSPHRVYVLEGPVQLTAVR